MRTQDINFKLMFLLIFLPIILGLAASPLYAQYLGEVTWTVVKNEDETGPKTPKTHTMKTGISRMGAGYYTVQGIGIAPDDNPSIMSGGCTLVDNNLFFTLNCAQQHVSPNVWRDTGIIYILVDKTTFSGTWWSVWNCFDIIGRVFKNRYAAGTITGQPLPLVAGAAPLMLLFD